MTPTLKLVTADLSASIDLYNGTLKLIDGSWQTKTPSVRHDFKELMFGLTTTFQGYERVRETLGLLGVNTEANLRAAVNAIEAYQEQIRLWHNDPCQDTSIWLEVGSEGEEPRRALLYDLVLDYPAMLAGVNPLLPTAKLQAHLALTRHPLWESITNYGYSSGDIPALGGSWTLTPTVICTAPHRLNLCQIIPKAGSGPFYRVWAGIRETYEGFSHFLSNWECELGTRAGGATQQASAGASSGYYVQATPTATATKYLTIKVADVSAFPLEQIGQYTLLCRCRVSSGEVAVIAKSGASGMADADHRANEAAYVSNTSWRFAELGEIQIPISGWRVGHADVNTIRSTEIQLYAELVSGSGVTLDLDCLVLIPARHFIKIEETGINASYGYAYIYVDENEATTVLVNNAAGHTAPVMKQTIRDWYLPIAGGLSVWAAERAASQELTDIIRASVSEYPRWLSYRGA
jgi:hypothetical protein